MVHANTQTQMTTPRSASTNLSITARGAIALWLCAHKYLIKKQGNETKIGLTQGEGAGND